MNILEELQWRGLLADCTDPQELAKRTSPGPITLYCGFDPTADSLHVGNLVPPYERGGTYHGTSAALEVSARAFFFRGGGLLSRAGGHVLYHSTSAAEIGPCPSSKNRPSS